eukprot:CAMPEP_0179464106 /NCGR_PEP_ID=MMETSP0799-20121207/46006_1 /TAXON_ID=46947 /ORGANISM="Geminigera cryophila, Strain CCMP2564" /LENGTH=113 /DNA_ID=CAMNT_0021267725 /DNA_START=129 /DNA_END=470 /DNA_ORIENTATION=-
MTEMSTDMMSSSSANGAQVASVCAKTVITMGTDGASTVTTGGCTPKGYCQAQETMIKVAVAMGEALGADASDMPKVKSCSECSGDNCNAAGGLRTGAWIALLASAATLLAFHN